MNKVTTGLFLESGKEIYFNLTSEIEDLLKKLNFLYLQLNEFDDSRNYRDNMIKTVLSDIEIESIVETSVIDSIAAICCGKIKNKNQRTALNMLNILESGILEKSKILSHEYIFELWSYLTYKNKNFLQFDVGYRKRSVSVYKIGKYFFNVKEIHKAPNYKLVPNMMAQFLNFVNSVHLLTNAFNDAIIKGILLNGYFVYVHPFLDGNGRTSRLLITKYLIDSGLSKFRYISLASMLKKYKDDYSRNLIAIETQNDGDFTDYVLFMLTVMLNTFRSILSAKNEMIVVSGLSNREKIMLKVIMGSNQGISVKTYKHMWNKIASENKYKKIGVEDAEKDISHLFDLGFLTVDERYVNYPGFKYYNK